MIVDLDAHQVSLMPFFGVIFCKICSVGCSSFVYLLVGPSICLAPQLLSWRSLIPDSKAASESQDATSALLLQRYTTLLLYYFHVCNMSL